MNDDMAGLKLNAKFDMLGATLFWSKYEENARVSEDDIDLYVLQLSLDPTPALKLGLETFYQNNQMNDLDEYWIGATAAGKLSAADLSGWFAYNFGTDDSGEDKVDIAAWAAAVKGSMAVAGGNVALRVMYYSKDDDAEDDASFNQADSSSGYGSGSGAYEFYDAGLMIFLTDMDYNNFGGGRLAFTDAAYAGYGLIGGVLSGSFTPPAMKQMYIKGALGYFAALDDKVNDEADKSREGTSLGTELAVKVGYKIADKVDVSLRGAYGMLGNFYDKQAADGEDPDDLYKLIAMVNVPY